MTNKYPTANPMVKDQPGAEPATEATDVNSIRIDVSSLDEQCVIVFCSRFWGESPMSADSVNYT